MFPMKFEKGFVNYDEFHIDFEKPLREQEELLTEDLLQVQFDDDKILDLGWYPEFNSNGNFVLQIIKKLNWDAPFYKKESRDVKTLFENIEEALDLLK